MLSSGKPPITSKVSNVFFYFDVDGVHLFVLRALLTGCLRLGEALEVVVKELARARESSSDDHKAGRQHV